MKTRNNYRFDFTLYINDKIICQRLFDDYNYNKKNIDSKVAVDIITVTTNLMSDFFKSESIKLLWNNYDYFNPQKMCYNKSQKDLFKVTISFNSKIIISNSIEGYGYPPKGKYNVDIRPIIPIIISNIRVCLK